MKTQKPLEQLIPDILEHYNKYLDLLNFNQRIYLMLEGQIREEVEQSLRREIISQSALRRALERIPPINILRKTTDKLSKVYIENPIRFADNETDQDIMANISRACNIDSVMATANRILNAQKMAALEPYIEDGKHQVRVLAGHQFLPFSDDPQNPNVMTVFIKLLGKDYVTRSAVYDEYGRLLEREDKREVTILALYSDDEFMIIDTGGAIRYDKMAEIGVTNTLNPFGRIPFIYIKTSTLELIPYANQEGFDISVLIPKLLTDLNYAAQFMSHSIIWSKNADLSGQEINPDAIVDLGDRSAEDGEPEIGTIDPKVDIANILALIEYEVSSYFSSVGIKTQASGMMSNGRDASGIAKAIDEGDTTSARKEQIELFRAVEKSFWDLMSRIQSVWSSMNATEENRSFGPAFSDTFRIVFAEMKPLKSQREKIEEVQLMREQKLMTRRQALRMLYPDLTESQLQDWLKELDDEAMEDAEKMLEFGISAGPERKTDGTFNDGNVAAKDQEPAAAKVEAVG